MLTKANAESVALEANHATVSANRRRACALGSPA